MRVLFLVNEQPDYLQDIVFHGLVARLGHENVVDFPQLARYRSEPPHESPFASLYFNVPGRRSGELRDLVEEADAIVIGSLREGVREHVEHVFHMRGRRPVAFLDGEDEPYVKGVIDFVDLYFKRETLLSAPRLRVRMPLRRLYHAHRRPERWRDPLRREIAVATARTKRVIPLPLGVIDVGLTPSNSKDYDLAFLATPHNPERELLLRRLRSLAVDGYRVYLPPQNGRLLPWMDYMSVLARSRIGVSLRGLGNDTYRYWEIPYAGAVLLAEPSRIVVPENFVDRVEAVFAPPARIPDVARELLAGPTEEIGAAGRAKLLRSHTSLARADVVIRHLEQLLVSGRRGGGPRR